MSFKGKTYSRKGGGGKAGNPFDRMMKEQCNKPVAAKSAGIVGKWGATSFTSVRSTADGQNPSVPKVKKFFKSRTAGNSAEGDNSSECTGGEAPLVTVCSAKIINVPEPRPAGRTRDVSEPRAERETTEPALPPVRVRPSRRAAPHSPPPAPPRAAAGRRGGKAARLPDSRENPGDRAAKLLALIDSQSKENQPRDPASPPKSGKRKSEDTLPPIKLKLSLSKSPTKLAAEEYAVVRKDPPVFYPASPASDSTDISNGTAVSNGGHSLTSRTKSDQDIVEQSDLELLNRDFISEKSEIETIDEYLEKFPVTKPMSRPSESPPRKAPRIASNVPSSKPEQNVEKDPWDVLMETKPSSKRSRNIVQKQKQQSPEFEVSSSDQNKKLKDLMENLESVPSRKSPPTMPQSPELDMFEMNYPKRISSIGSKDSKPAPSKYQKSIFRSRLKKSDESSGSSLPKAETVKEPARVPPISLNLLEFETDSSPKKIEPQPRAKSKFFKSRDKPGSSTQSLNSNLVKSSIAESKSSSLPPRVPSLLSDFESSSQPSSGIGSSSPDAIEYPARKQATEKPSSLGKPVKRSIFKSKAKENQENKAPPKKALSLYKHKMGWGGDKEELGQLDKDGEEEVSLSAPIVSSYDNLDEFDDNEDVKESDISFAPSKLTRVATYPTNSTGLNDDGDLVTQVKCPKSYKEYFKVIKNVKTAHEINDIGEFQEFTDDVEYISDGMKPRNSIAARCLAAISLAVKCTKPNFRMHLRAHGEVSKFFAELKDAPSNPSLALCTSTILFVLSQDRLNMDMDRDSLELMLNLLDTDCNIKNALEGSGLAKTELAKNKQKVIDICTEMQTKGHAGTLNLEMISADHLAMETLLSMTSKRAGEWFKEELRELGGLGHLAKTLNDCVSYLTVKEITTWTEQLTEKLKKANRILRVLENVSHENEENCSYLVEYGNTIEKEEEPILDVLQKLFQLLDAEVQLNPTTDFADKESVGFILRETLFSVIRVHINLVHDYRNKAYGSVHVGQKKGCMATVLRCLFIMPYWFCPLGKRFEALVLSLTLLINMVEHCDENRQTLMDSMAAQKDSDFCVKEEPRMAVEDLVQLFIDRDTLAKMSEEKTDNILDCVDEEVQEIDPREDSAKKNDKPTLDETVQKLIGKAGNHMESTLIAAYVGLVMGYLVQNSDDYECRIREYLPSRNFKDVVAVLAKLLNFMKMTSIGTLASSKGIKATEKIIKHLEKIDSEPIEEEEEREENIDFTLFDVSKDDTTLIDQTENFASTSYSLDDWGNF